MSYESLAHVYYKNPAAYETEYTRRFDSPSAVHMLINIRQAHRKEAYPAFFLYHNDLALMMEQFYKSYEQFLKMINSSAPVVIHQFKLLSILDEVKSTNEIEGVHSTRKEIRDIIDGKVSHTTRQVSIVHKYNELLTDKEIHFENCQDIRDFYDEFAHEEIINENPAHRLDGKVFRKDPVGVESAIEKVIHQGLFPESAIISAMNKALTLLHDKNLPVLVRLALFHYFFAYIHPFYDGNGRTDRFITSYYLSRHFNQLLALRLSITIKRNKSPYYHLLSEADSKLNRGDLTPFIIGFMQILVNTTKDTIDLLTRKNKQLEVYKKKIENLQQHDRLMKDIYFILLQAALFYGKGVSVADLVSLTSKSRLTIRDRLQKIPVNHLLSMKIGRTNYYRLNLMIFK